MCRRKIGSVHPLTDFYSYCLSNFAGHKTPLQDFFAVASHLWLIGLSAVCRLAPLNEAFSLRALGLHYKLDDIKRVAP